MHWLRALGVFGAALALFGVAACGGDDDADDGSNATTFSAMSVKVAQGTSNGTLLTSANGMTLYVFTQDTTGKSVCNDTCAATWPPLEASAAPSSVEGATGDFSLITRDDGKKQLAFRGRPLYRYAADKAAGDANGEGVGGVWFIARADGAVPQSSASPAAGTTPAADGGNPYNY